jgi:hypothetical protein
MCIAEPVNVRVFRKFFIQLDLPYKATRFELFDVKATVFYYGQENDPPKSVRKINISLLYDSLSRWRTKVTLYEGCLHLFIIPHVQIQSNLV